jgi:hypothetical protein
MYCFHIYFNHVLVDIYHVYEDLYNGLSGLSMTSKTYIMYIQNCTMYMNTFTMFIDAFNMYEGLLICLLIILSCLEGIIYIYIYIHIYIYIYYNICIEARYYCNNAAFEFCDPENMGIYTKIKFLCRLRTEICKKQ